jgi:hypothetical protein
VVKHSQYFKCFVFRSHTSVLLSYFKTYHRISRITWFHSISIRPDKKMFYSLYMVYFFNSILLIKLLKLVFFYHSLLWKVGSYWDWVKSGDTWYSMISLEIGKKDGSVTTKNKTFKGEYTNIACIDLYQCIQVNIYKLYQCIQVNTSYISVFISIQVISVYSYQYKLYQCIQVNTSYISIFRSIYTSYTSVFRSIHARSVYSGQYKLYQCIQVNTSYISVFRSIQAISLNTLI